jgi:hypothetical protein
VPTRFEDILLAFEHLNLNGGANMYDVRICRPTGKIYIHSESVMDLEYSDDFPDDIDDEEKYVAMPNKHDLNLGKSTVLKFAREYLVDDYDEVRRIFAKRGAYAKFKTLLIRRGALEHWHGFENEATEQALREWCKINGVDLID